MEKTFKEKLGDALHHTGKRFLICLGLAVAGFLLSALSAVFPLAVLLGGPLAYFGVFGAVSIIGKTKTYLAGGVAVPGPDGKVIPCAVIIRKYYAYMPIVPVVCPFYYFPHKTSYFIIKNITAPAVEKPVRINDHVLAAGLLDTEEISLGQYKALLARPGDFYGQIADSVGDAREKFLSDAAPFFETGVFTEVYYTDQISVCKTPDEGLAMFHYADDSGSQIGIVINEELFEIVKKDTGDLLDAYVSRPDYVSRCLIDLSDATLQRIMNAPERLDDIDPEAVKKQQEELDREKTVITREMVRDAQKSKLITSKKIWGFFWAFWCVLLAVCGLFGGPVTIVMFTILGGGFCGYLSVDFFVTAARNKKRFESGDFTVVKVRCTDIEETTDEDGTLYTCVFANGERISGTPPVCTVGDHFYFIYLEGEKASEIYYHGLQYVPAPDLKMDEIKL